MSSCSILSGCGHVTTAPAEHRVQLSRECERLAANVDHPPMPTKAKPPQVTVGEYAVALTEANDNIDATRECQRRQRERLAGKR